MSEPKACILSVSGLQLTGEERKFLTSANPWAVILMGRSVSTRVQVSALVDEIFTALGRDCLIFIDQEGGRVRRLRPPEWPDFPPPGAYAAIYRKNPEAGVEAAWLGHRLIASELTQIGIRADCAPVLDMLHPGAHDIVGDRALGDKPEHVATLGRAALEGLGDGGVAGVVKHIPGHGRALLDSHLALPTVSAPLEELETDFAPFSALRDAPMAMTAHIAYEALDPGIAATVSRKIVDDVIRGRIGFDGLLMSDDLGMSALGGTLADRASGAFGAGCDIALHCAGFVKEAGAILREMQDIAEVSPSLSGKAKARAEAAESATLHAVEFDMEEGWERFNSLLALQGEALA